MKLFLPRAGRTCLLALLLFSGLNLFAQTEVAVNGGFETGDFTGWDQFPSTAGQQTVGDFAPTEGAFAANVNNEVAPSASGIKLSNVGIGVVTPGAEITVSFDFRGTAANGGILFAEFFSEIDGGGTSSNEFLGGGPLFPNADPAVWTSVSFTTTAGSDVSGGVSLLLNAVTGAAAGSVANIFYDNVSIVVGPPAEMVAITFNVGTSNLLSVDPAGIFIAGGGNFGNPGDNALTDPDGDGVYSITVMRPVGFSSFYAFTDGACPDFSCKEDLSGQPCGDPNNFNDRFLPAVTQDTILSTCFGECTIDTDCSPPPGTVEITFNVGTNNIIDLSPDGIFIAGGGNFGNPGDNPLTDPDGDGIYSITLTLPEGFESFYTFTNGICPDFSCKEDISGQSCANPNNFNDRFLPAVFQDTVLSTCFGLCTEDSNCPDPAGANVEYCVDIGCIMPTGTVNVFGIFPGSFFDPFANEMMDDDGDGIYCTTVFLEPGDTEFKFIINPGMPNEINENFMVGDDCTVSTPDGQFTNRIITVEDGVDQMTGFVFDVPCESVLVEPTLDFPEVALQCAGGETVTITGGATPEGGVYSGEGVTDNADGTFDIVLPAMGEVEVTYTFMGDLECEYTTTSTVTVDNVEPTVTVNADPFVIELGDESEMTFEIEDFVTVSDNCGIESVEADRPLTFTGADIGAGSFLVTVTDANGNITIVTINFVVNFDQPNLGCRGNINLTLNDGCQGLIVPSMVLTGNTALLDVFDFDIVVQDNDPTNGPIVDGCGEFTYTISSSVSSGTASNGFTGAFSEDNFDVVVGGDAEVVFTDDEINFTSPNVTGGIFLDDAASVSYQFSEDGTVAFDLDFSLEADIIVDIFIVDFDGNIIFETSDDEVGTNAGTASITQDVMPGSTLTLTLQGDGFASFGQQSFVTVNNFSFTTGAVLGLDFDTCWGTVTAEDKTAPAVVNQIAPIDLLCVDIDDNQVNLLPNNIDRCYEVFSATGATVPGTMATALRNALSANVGSTAAVVPTFTDGCTERLEVCVAESIEFDPLDPQCNDAVLTRTFTATEIAICPSASGESNGSTVSSYVITFSRPDLDDLDGDNIEDVANYDRCGVTTGTIADIRADYPAPRAGDFPFLSLEGRTFPLQSGSAVCNIGVTFSDGDPIITCPNTYKFVRTYTVIDWCDPSDVRTFTQVVKVGDTEAPTFTGPTQDRNFDGIVDGDLIFNTNAGNVCAAYIILDGPGVGAVDNCDDDVTITATIFPDGDFGATPIGAFDVDTNDGNAEVTSPIPVGTHILRYTFTDNCGNSDFEDFEFTVVDGTAPVAICEDGLNISITSGSANGGASTGIAILTPSMIDNGSYDDCSGVTLEIARVNGSNVATEAYDQELVLTCADLGIVRVGLKVTDLLGNMNFCWLDVLVEDKNIPTCIPPGPMTVTCVDYRAAGLPADITEATEDELNALFGSAVGIDNCEVTVTSTVSGNVNSCGIGNLTRNFLSTDGEGFVDNDNCVQRISITGIFDYRITFPTDEESGCADIPAFDGLATDEFACDLITVNVSVDTIAAVNAPDACFTLRVNYDVINFCEYNQLGECYRIPRDGDGIRNPDTQLLYLNVIPNSTVNTADDIAFLSRFTDRNYNPTAPQRDQLVDDGDDNDGSDDDNDNDSEESQAANGVGFAYAQDDSRGFFCYVQFVDVYDNDAPVITGDTPDECFAGTSAECEAEVTLTFTAEDECTTPVVTVELDANYISGSFVPTNPASVGVGVTVSNDGPDYTINATNVPVGTHAVRIRANDGCGNFDTEVIVFCVEGDKAPTPICIQTLTVTLMPDGMGDGMAEIWASDFIASDVEDCFGNVIDKYSMYTEEEAGAAGFAPAAGDLGVSFTCADFGESVPVRVYAIADNGSADYCSVIVEVQAFQEGLCDGGGNLAGTILTQDEVAVEGVEVNLTGANDMDVLSMTAANGSFSFTNLPLGADYTVQPNFVVPVNLSNVTVADVNLMGNVILGIDQFATAYDYLAADVDQDQSLSVGDMVFTQRVILGLDNDFGVEGNWNFVPADVDVSNPYGEAFPGVYNVNDLAANFFNADFVALEMGNVNAANRSAASIEVENVELSAGQTHTIVMNSNELLGFQGTLELAAGLELVNVTYVGEGGLNLNGAAEGVIAMMFLADATVNVEVRATEAALLSDMVSLTSGVTVAEGVNLNGTAGPLSLNFTTVAGAELVNVLEQNTPNPVADVTRIGYTLATAGNVTLTIQDIAGRTVSVRELTGVAGRNVVELNVSELKGATGVLSYTLVSGDFSATKKMVVVR